MLDRVGVGTSAGAVSIEIPSAIPKRYAIGSVSLDIDLLPPIRTKRALRPGVLAAQRQHEGKTVSAKFFFVDFRSANAVWVKQCCAFRRRFAQRIGYW